MRWSIAVGVATLLMAACAGESDGGTTSTGPLRAVGDDATTTSQAAATTTSNPATITTVAGDTCDPTELEWDPSDIRLIRQEHADMPLLTMATEELHALICVIVESIESGTTPVDIFESHAAELGFLPSAEPHRASDWSQPAIASYTGLTTRQCDEGKVLHDLIYEIQFQMIESPAAGSTLRYFAVCDA